MNLLEALIAGDNKQSVQQIASAAGLDTSNALQVLGQLVPALTGGLKRNVSSAGGLESLSQALSNGDHQRYLEDPSRLTSAEGLEEGKAILGHVLGSKDASREIAAQAASQTGVDVDTIKQMLPMVAAAAMGALGKQAKATPGSADVSTAAAAPGTGVLAALLDTDKDGSVTDDLANLAKRFF